MTDGSLPVPVDPVHDSDRTAAVSRLRDLVGSGELSYERFLSTLDLTLAASTQGELEAAFTALPSVVHLSPASRRLGRPVVIEARMSSLDLGPGFQLGSDTSVVASVGSVWLDLTAANWDAREVDLRLQATTGSIDVIVPRGVAVQLVQAKGQVVLEDLAPPVPGAPVLRIDAIARTGQIRLTHSSERGSGSRSSRRRSRGQRG